MKSNVILLCSPSLLSPFVACGSLRGSFLGPTIALVLCWLQFQHLEFFNAFIRFSFCILMFFHDKIMFCMKSNVILLFSPSPLSAFVVCGSRCGSFFEPKYISGVLLATVSTLGMFLRLYTIFTFTFPIFGSILLDFEGSPWDPHFPLLEALTCLDSPGPLLEPPGLQKWSFPISLAYLLR